VRAVLEGHGAVLAMEHMDDEDLQHLTDLVDRMREAAGAGDPYGEATADTEFHRLIIHRSGNATLERVWSTLEPFLRTYITIVSPGVDRRAVADRHIPIIDALRRREAPLIEAAFREHFSAAATALAQVWPTREAADEGGRQQRPEEEPAIPI
jgi:DNA-binding GntR family transcriptional regulator